MRVNCTGLFHCRVMISVVGHIWRPYCWRVSTAHCLQGVILLSHSQSTVLRNAICFFNKPRDPRHWFFMHSVFICYDKRFVFVFVANVWCCDAGFVDVWLAHSIVGSYGTFCHLPRPIHRCRLRDRQLQERQSGKCHLSWGTPDVLNALA